MAEVSHPCLDDHPNQKGRTGKQRSKWTQACDRRLARLISYIHFTNIVMWEMRLNIVDWCHFKMQTLQEIWKTQNPHQAKFCALWEVEHLYRSVGCARSKRQFRTAPQNQRSAGLRMDGLPALDLLDSVIEVLGTTPRVPKTNPSMHTGKPVLSPSTPKIKQVLDQNVEH